MTFWNSQPSTTSPARSCGRLASVTLALAFALAPALRAEEPLRWKFQEGETIRYALVQKTETKLKSTAHESSSSVNQISDIRWVVREVSESGTAKLTQVIDRVRVKFDAGGSGFEFDSADKDALDDNNPFVQQVVPVFQALAGFECTLTMDPLGRIEDVQIPEKTLESLRATLAGAMSSVFSEDSMRKMISQSSLVLPEKGLDVGETWSDEARFVMPDLGTIVTAKTYTVKGPDKDDASKIHIALDAKLAVEAGDKPQVELEIKEQKHEGDFTFDTVKGRIAQSHVEVNTVQLITVGPNKLEQTISNMMDMTIDPDEKTAE